MPIIRANPNLFDNFFDEILKSKYFKLTTDLQLLIIAYSV